MLIQRLSCGLAFLTFTFASGAAHAQSAVAEDLFQQGQKLMEEGKLSEACARFAESQKVEPSNGTLLNLAVCHEKEKKTASAWAEYNGAANMARAAGRPDREKYARDKADALAPLLRKVQLDVKEQLTNPEVKIDGQPGGGVINMPFPIDPGEHELTVSATKKKPWTTKVKFAEGAGVVHVEVPGLEEAPVEQAPAGGVQSGTTLQVGGSDHDPAAAARTKRVAGIIVGIAGVAAIGTGIGFLVRAKIADDRATETTASANAKPTPSNVEQLKQSANDFHDTASSSQTIGLIAGGLGVVAVGVGAFLYFTAKDPSAEKAAKNHQPIRDIRVTPLFGQTRGAAMSFSF